MSDLVEPASVDYGDRVWVYVGERGDPPRTVWRIARVVVGAGDHARVVFRADDGTVVDTWRPLTELRVESTGAVSA